MFPRSWELYLFVGPANCAPVMRHVPSHFLWTCIDLSELPQLA